jgi:hypothetical protein
MNLFNETTITNENMSIKKIYKTRIDLLSLNMELRQNEHAANNSYVWINSTEYSSQNSQRRTT